MIALRFNNDTGEADVEWSRGHLVEGFDLETAVTISLFANALNPDRQAGEEPGGSPLDEFTPDPMGSRLWTLERRKATGPEGAKTLQDAERFAVEALQWMIADGIASDVTAAAEWVQPVPYSYVLALRVDVVRPETRDPVTLGPWELFDAF